MRKGRTIKVINVDLDGVVYPWHEQMAVWIIRQTLPIYGPFNKMKNYTWESGEVFGLPEPTRWDFHDDWNMTSGQFRAHFRKGVEEGHIWAYGDPIRDSVDTLWRLSSEGWNIRIVTNRLVHKFGHKQAVVATADWLDRHNVPYWDLFFTGRTSKLDIKADAYIDDNIHNLPPSNYSMLFLRSWNEVPTFPGYTGRTIGVDGWKEAYQALAEGRVSSEVPASGEMGEIEDVQDGSSSASDVSSTRNEPDEFHSVVW